MDFQKDIEDLKTSLEIAHQANKVTQTQVGNCIHDIRSAVSRIEILEKDLKLLRNYASELEEYCISLDTTIRNHHILISGIAECSEELINLVAFRVLQTCYAELDINDIDYAYRIGFNPINRPEGKRKHRPVLVKLLKEDHRRLIFKNRKILKDTEEYSDVYLNDDLPQVVNERRADIRSVYQNAISKGQNASMAGSKITVNNVTYKYNELKNLPAGLCLSDTKLVQVKGGLAFCSHHAYLSNFYPCMFQINGQTFDSAERAYQYSRAMHLHAPEVAKNILTARNAKECKKQSYFIESKAEWDSSKRGVMKMIVQEKFSQNADLKEKLLSTGTTMLIEATSDNYWGAGSLLGSKLLKEGKWTGRNELGIILNEVREDLRRTEKWKAGATANLRSLEAGQSRVPTGISIESRPGNSTQCAISFVPPDLSEQVQSALNDYTNRKSKKSGGNRRGGNRKQNQSQVKQSGNATRPQVAHAQGPPTSQLTSHSKSMHGHQQSSNTAANKDSRQSNVNKAGSYPSNNAAQVGHQGSFNQNLHTDMSLPNVQFPPPGMPFAIPPYPYMPSNPGYFPGYMGHSVPPMMPYPAPQFGVPPVMMNPEHYQSQNQNQNLLQATPSINSGSTPRQAVSVNTQSHLSSPSNAEAHIETGTHNRASVTEEYQLNNVEMTDVTSNINNVDSISNIGTENGKQKQTQPAPEPNAAVAKEVPSPSKIAETLFPDDLMIRIGTQEI